MVTVIPVIILLAGAEIGALLNRRQQNEKRVNGLIQAAQGRCLTRIQAGETPDTRDLQISRREFPYDSEMSSVATLYWIASCASAFLAEWLLIAWLAMKEKPESGARAYFIAITAINGFGAVLASIFSLRSESRAFDKLLKANSHPALPDPALIPWLALPPQPRVAPTPTSEGT
ncbi:hypothetical protein [Streptomyces gardneri]|uniref:hypothetical protein n=1 Tax=Streptomyces gardneri TaxID=66892 RepID=UPI0035D54543